MTNNLYGVAGTIKSGKDTLTDMFLYLKDYPEAKFEDLPKPEDFFSSSFQVKKYADKLKNIVCILIGCNRADLENQEFKNTPIPGWERYKVIVKTLCGNEILYFSNMESVKKEMEVGGKLFGSDFKNPVKEFITPRMLMQIVGSKAGRDLVHPDIWCKALFSDYKCIPVEGGFNRVVKSEEGIPVDYELECEYPKWIISDLRYPDNEGHYIKINGGVTVGVKRRFSLRFPEYAHLEDERYPYKVPYSLNSEDPELYEALTFESEMVMGDLDWADYVIVNDGTLEELFYEVKKMLTIL